LQVVACTDDSACVFLVDYATATLQALLTGHAGIVRSASTCPGLPNLVVAGSRECRVVL